MDNKDKVDFDLDFLDKNVKEKPKQKPNSSKDPNWVFYEGNKGTNKNPASDYSKGPSKNWLWVLGVIGFFIIVGLFSGDSNSTSTTSSTNNGLVQVGQYMCSTYYADQADNMAPSSVTKAELDSETDRIDAITNARIAEKKYLDTTYVDETDQWAIDNYNSRVRA